VLTKSSYLAIARYSRWSRHDEDLLPGEDQLTGRASLLGQLCRTASVPHRHQLATCRRPGVKGEALDVFANDLHLTG